MHAAISPSVSKGTDSRGASTRRWIGMASLFSTVLLASCGGGGGSPSPAPPPSSSLTVSGTAEYQSVAIGSTGSLNYGAQTFKPIRGATVQLLNAAGTVLATTATNATGAYSFPAVNTPSGAVRVRVRAEYTSTAAGGPATNITINDNTNTDALYVLESAGVTPAGATQTIDVRAGSGWGGSSYTGTRSAGPFAVLDTMYQAAQKVRTAVPTQALPPLRVFWSPRNVPSGGGSDAELARGEIGTSFFLGLTNDLRIYLLGAENTDTDEYDSPVVAHEWGHYLQTAVSRDDSVGGPHSLNDKLDMRVAFSEGFGNAFAGMVLGNPRYTDSFGAAQGRGFVIDVSSNQSANNRGWFSEDSVQTLLWSWHQNGQIGFLPLYQTLTGSMRTSGALVGIHHFAQRLRLGVPAAAGTINSALQAQSITVQDEWGTGESNTGGVTDVLPLYGGIVGGAARVCVNDTVGAPNKLRNYAYLRFTTGAGGFTIRVTPEAGLTGTDPDFVVVAADGTRRFATASTADLETLQLTLPAGTHSLVVEEFNLTANDTPEGQRCLNVTIS